MLDREYLYGLVFDKDWEAFAELMYQNSKEVMTTSDPLIAQAIKVFEEQFINDINTKTDEEKEVLLKWPSQLVVIQGNPFNQEFADNVLIARLEALLNLNFELAVDLAKEHQHRLELAKKIMTRARKQNYYNDGLANIKQTSTTVTDTSKVIKLFKSQQEKNFFQAVKNVFPSFFPYPNVALNAILDFNLIKNELSLNEREYFFRGMVDCVIFDPAKEYFPIKFFELDSVFHDNEKAKERDEMKDSIFRKSNVKLYRIRAELGEQISVESFEELIRELD
ncbi:DUF2726 domain-containing protein [Thiomicrorhabdus sp. 6S3-12]|uniref:DUF2726 domain-containing protein n=1 Tax=Thiomicrorhabdus sp. 6S3-12 TaxID=2819681 RepID=UPI001AACC8DE|nr:DUF2726 domain-containing protein [Thiomicrorhabdus sp. 6S3-12]MBO1923281.1 DUF2726 domain-containing protein [Thiomicrorhabdus sp. 6S3-12]